MNTNLVNKEQDRDYKYAKLTFKSPF